MSPVLPTASLEWVIIGGGPIGIHVAVRLLAEGAASPSQIRIIDPAPKLLHKWEACTFSTGMRYLRSPAVHHIGEKPFELLEFASQKRGFWQRRGLFTDPYQRPALSLFKEHCESVIQKHGLADLHIRERVDHIQISPESLQLQLKNRTLSTRRAILALGNSEQPFWPEQAKALRQGGGCVIHIFGDTGRLEPSALPDRVAIIGGGISAAQLAMKLAKSGKTVTILSRHEPREHQFDSDPGWIGPKFMRGFWAVSDYRRRRAMIQSARHKGSMPPDVLQELQHSMARGAVTWRVGELSGGNVTEQGDMRLEFGPTRTALRVDALVLATGFSPKRPGGAMVDRLIAAHALPVSECGYPMIDQELRWHPRIFVTGALSELEIGPTARNITGGRRAAERIIQATRSEAQSTSPSRRMSRSAAIALMLMLAIPSTGCKPRGTTDSNLDSQAQPLSPIGNLLIEEVYYSGAVPTAGIDRYYSDQFVELVNIADAPVMVGGLIIGDAPGSSGAINPGDQPGGRFIADPDYVFLTTAWRIPGEPEEVLLAPGESLVIAQDASTHNPYSPINLFEAHYETYVAEFGEDIDNAGVPDLESVWYNSGYDWLVTVFGPTIVVLDSEGEDLEPAGGRRGPVQAPVSAVVDTMEALMDADSGAYKRLHSSVDSGFVYVSGTYTGESVRRRRNDSGVLIDTNDSGADFEVVQTPDPAIDSMD